MNKYVLQSIRRTQPPKNASKKIWYEYIITNKINTITGCRADNYHSILLFINETIINLNRYYIPNESKIFSPVKESYKMMAPGNIRTDW